MSEYRDKLLGFRGIPNKGTAQTVTDEHNNDTTQHWDGRQDVLIRAPKVVMTMQQREER